MRGFIGIVVVCLSACATAPKFEKTVGAQGYTVSERSGADHFAVSLNLPSGQEARFYKNYGSRAVGKECKTRGFELFNVAQLSLGQYEGFCALKMPKILGIRYAEAGLESIPPTFVVEEVFDKPKTFVKVGDRVLEMNDHKLITKADFIKETFLANKAGKTSQKLKIERASGLMTVDEPMFDGDRPYLGPEDLENLRATF